jgi:hypothetical protein
MLSTSDMLYAANAGTPNPAIKKMAKKKGYNLVVPGEKKKFPSSLATGTKAPKAQYVQKFVNGLTKHGG